MRSIFIITFPRTASTHLYISLLRIYNDRLGIFEPFNKDYLQGLKTSGKIIHDIEREVPHHYFSLNKSLLNLIFTNSAWLDAWISSTCPEVPYLGWAWEEIVRDLASLNVVLKDVYAWVRLREMLETLPPSKVFFIALVRDIDSIYNSFRKWLENNYMKNKLARIVRKARELGLVEALKRFKRGIKILTHKSPALSPLNIFSLGIFYRAIYGYDDYIASVRKVNEDVLKQVLGKVYRHYVKLVTECAKKYDNILVYRFGEYLRIEKIVDEVLRQVPF